MNLGVVVFPQVEELDFVGPWEMFTMWKQVADGPESCLIVAERKEPVACAKGLSVNPHVSFEECPALDFMLVPGGQGTRAEVSNPRMLEFVATQARSCKAVLSVCTGSFVLHAAGLLSGKRATTHWGSLDRLRALGDVDVVEERFTQDGNVWCSAGVSAGIDLALRFIAEVAGQDAAGKVQFAAEYYPSGSLYGDYKHHAKAPAYIRDA
jgi:transcriptional regulator GlxA family with amidase domain